MKKIISTVGAIVIATTLMFGPVAPATAAPSKAPVTTVVKNGKKVYTYTSPTTGKTISFSFKKKNPPYATKAEVRRMVARALIKTYYARR